MVNIIKYIRIVKSPLEVPNYGLEAIDFRKYNIPLQYILQKQTQPQKSDEHQPGSNTVRYLFPIYQCYVCMLRLTWNLKAKKKYALQIKFKINILMSSFALNIYSGEKKITPLFSLTFQAIISRWEKSVHRLPSSGSLSHLLTADPWNISTCCHLSLPWTSCFLGQAFFFLSSLLWKGSFRLTLYIFHLLVLDLYSLNIRFCSTFVPYSVISP